MARKRIDTSQVHLGSIEVEPDRKVEPLGTDARFMVLQLCAFENIEVARQDGAPALEMKMARPIEEPFFYSPIFTSRAFAEAYSAGRFSIMEIATSVLPKGVRS